jgi:PIN domain nuclease of toxin-antitoxin system
MKLLLDTHIWIWATLQPTKLSAKVRRALQQPANELFLSPVSIWEAHHLEKRGRLRLKQPFEVWVRQALDSAPLHEAPFTQAVALAATTITLPQPDPGDVFLAATAVVMGLTLVTGDEQLLASAQFSVLAN